MSASNYEENEKHRHLRLWVTLAAIPFLVAAALASWLGLGNAVEIPLDALALSIAAAPVLFDAVRRVTRYPFSADVLMSVAAVGAAAIGAWHEGAAVILLYNFAETVEDYTVDRVRNIAKKTAGLLPQRALVVRDGVPIDVKVEAINVGDLVLVKPGWRIPVDGIVVQGHSNVDESTVTGESVPVEVSGGSRVLSGTLNLDGSIELKARKAFRDSTVSRIVRLVMESQEKKAEVERFVDRFSKRYTPAVIILAVLVGTLPPLILGDPASVWVYRALIVLITACPSALVISTPVTVLLGLTRSMRSGILVKGGKYMEEISRVNVVAFDKTGTLTVGKLEVSKVSGLNGFTENEALQLAAIAESRVAHPIGGAIVAEAQRRGIEITGQVSVTDHPGRGVDALVSSGSRTLVGKPSYLEQNGIEVNCPLPEAQKGETVVMVARDRELAGSIVLKDQLRAEAKETIEQLRVIGITKIVMLTGDSGPVAGKIASEAGLTDYYAQLLPEDKVAVARRLGREYGSVAMVGDGVNDAPVLAASNVGIALGTAGNDIAMESADVALMSSDLRAIPYLIRLGKKVVRKLRVNIGIALGLKILLISLGTLGFIPLWFAVIGDDGVTLVVIANALPILKFREFV